MVLLSYSDNYWLQYGYEKVLVLYKLVGHCRGQYIEC